MLDLINDYKDKGIVVVIFMSVIMIAISGIFFAFLYFVLSSVQTAMESTDCVIDNNSLVSSCQDLFSIALYPFLNMKELLIWGSFFFIFALVLGMLVLGYKAGSSPVLMGYLLVIVIAMTYLSIEISNIYRTLLENEIFRNWMIDFTVYNQIMLGFPWFVFIVTLLSVILGIVNYQKSAVNQDTDELNY